MLKELLAVEMEELRFIDDDASQQLDEDLATGCGALRTCGGDCNFPF